MVTIAVLGFLAGTSPSMFPSYIPAGVVTDIIQTAGFTSGLLGVIGTSLHLFSSSQPGAWAPQDPPVVVAATNVANLPPTASVLLVDQTKNAAVSAVNSHVAGK